MPSFCCFGRSTRRSTSDHLSDASTPSTRISKNPMTRGGAGMSWSGPCFPLFSWGYVSPISYPRGIGVILRPACAWMSSRRQRSPTDNSDRLLVPAQRLYLRHHRRVSVRIWVSRGLPPYRVARANSPPSASATEPRTPRCTSPPRRPHRGACPRGRAPLLRSGTATCVAAPPPRPGWRHPRGGARTP